MPRSMTGYGRATRSLERCELTVELRAVNHRYFDCTVRVPRAFSYVEEAVKARLAERISRGKVECYVTVDSTAGENLSVTVNEEAAESYVEALRSLAGKFGLKDDISLSLLCRFQDIFTVKNEREDEEAFTKTVLEVTNEAIDGFIEMSNFEGKRLADDVLSRADTIENAVSIIETRSPETVKEYSDRLEARIREFLGTTSIDESRILTEVAIFADKIAVNEETVRLRSHLTQLRGMLRSDAAVGRKLDFLVQEMNREINTIGSKASDSDIARIVVDVKAEIEKIREQIQNIE